ncbi:MAG: flagellin [Pseudomonadota bacterium]
MLTKSVSTFSLYRQQQTNLQRLNSDFATVNQEVASQRKSDISASAGPRTQELVESRGEIGRIDVFLANIETFESRASLMDAALTDIDEAVQDLMSQIVTNTPEPSVGVSGLPEAARGALDAINNALNLSLGGRSLFSGAQIDVAPMQNPETVNPASLLSPYDVMTAANLGAPYPPLTAPDAALAIAAIDDVFDGTNAATPQSFEQTFYNGAAGPSTINAEIGDGLQLDYGIAADDPALRQVLQGVYMLATVDMDALAGSPAYTDYVDAALARVSAGVADLRDVQGRLGFQQQQAAEAKEGLQTSRAFLVNTVVDLEVADPVEAQTRFEAIERQLDAAYAATVRASRLRLTNYL